MRWSCGTFLRSAPISKDLSNTASDRQTRRTSLRWTTSFMSSSNGLRQISFSMSSRRTLGINSRMGAGTVRFGYRRSIRVRPGWMPMWMCERYGGAQRRANRQVCRTLTPYTRAPNLIFGVYVRLSHRSEYAGSRYPTASIRFVSIQHRPYQSFTQRVNVRKYPPSRRYSLAPSPRRIHHVLRRTRLLCVMKVLFDVARQPSSTKPSAGSRIKVD
jgi:hypothetical protein